MATLSKHTVYGHRQVLSELQELPQDQADSLIEKCKEASLKAHPAEHPSVEVLKSTDLFRVRAGKSRAMIDYHMGQVRILRVGMRDGFYKAGSVQKAINRSYQQ